MDEFLEQMLSASSWGDGTGRTSWDSSVGNGDASESSCVPQSIARFSSVSMASSGPMGAMLPTQGLGSHNRRIHGSVAGTCLESKNAQYELQDTVFLPPTGLQTHTPLNRLAEAGTVAGGSMVLQLNTTSPIGKTLQNMPSIGGGGLPRGPAPLDTSSLSGHNAFGGSDFQQQPSWHQPYIGGVPPLQTTLGQGKQEMFVLNGEPLLNDTHLGKRSRNDEEMRNKNQQEARSHVAQSLGLQSGKIGYGDQMGVGQNEGTAAVANGSHGRLRVRARRGQATDPHSIAERNRRERIAERMKALQELVPDSNKTDKASMLDEIINYVKFLQMQVKCLSLCRLGGGGAAAPLLTDFQKEGSGFLGASQANGISGCQDGIAYAERQVARLMDEDMSAAMQYLQSKGLCLMPISLATAISSTGVRQQSGNAAMKSLELNASVSEKQQPADQSQFATGGSSDGDASGSDSASKLHGTLSLRKPFKGIAKDESPDEKVDSMTSL